MSAHIAHFYESDEAYANFLESFANACLRAGDACVILATPVHLAILEGKLDVSDAGGVGVDLAGLKPYIAMDAAETLARFMVDGEPDEVRFAEVMGQVLAQALKSGSRRVWVFAEMVGLLFEGGNQSAAVRLEQLWNRLVSNTAGVRIFLLCSYPGACLNSKHNRRWISAVCKEHSGVCIAPGLWS